MHGSTSVLRPSMRCGLGPKPVLEVSQCGRRPENKLFAQHTPRHCTNPSSQLPRLTPLWLSDHRQARSFYAQARKERERKPLSALLDISLPALKSNFKRKKERKKVFWGNSNIVRIKSGGGAWQQLRRHKRLCQVKNTEAWSQRGKRGQSLKEIYCHYTWTHYLK